MELEREIKQDERIRNSNLSQLDTADNERFSRRAIVLMRLIVVVLIIVAAIVLYRLVF